MKNRKVKNARFHVGITFPGHTGTSLDRALHKADMDLTAAGVAARIKDIKQVEHEYFIPFTNILFLELETDEK